MIKQICKIVEKLKTENKSIYILLKETGYFENSDLVTVKLIEEYLYIDKENVRNWIKYSSDKRTSSGWYILQKKIFTIVGYLNDGKTEQERKFFNVVQACAFFIVNEIKSIESN